MQGDEKRIVLIYQYASAVDDRCKEIMNSVINKESPQTIKENLEKLKQDMRTGWNHDSLLLENADNAIDELIQLKNYSNAKEIIEQICLIDLAYWNHMHELAYNGSLVFDVLEMHVKNQTGYEGKKFETELLPTVRSVTKRFLVRTGTGRDSSKNLTGEIDTILSSRGIITYKVENPHKGIYDIPADIIVPAAGGKSATYRFFIHYEIK